MDQERKRPEIEYNTLRNGYVIIARREFEDGLVPPERVELWIRKRDKGDGFSTMVLTVEERGRERFKIPALDIYEGVYEGPAGKFVIEGVFAPSKVGAVDPIRLLQAAANGRNHE